MRSIVAVTKEMDNAEKAVGELWTQIEAEGPLSKNGCAVVYCDVEMNHAPFVAALQKKLPFPLVGCTSISTFDRKNGTQTMAAVLCVLTADDATFSFALTNPLTSRNLREELKSAYGKVSVSIGGRGKLLLLVPPFATEVAPLDVFVDILSEASGDVPVFGGLPSSNMADGDILMYAEGAPHLDRAGIVLIDGNVRPLFVVKNILSSFSEKNGVVTKSDGNVIYEVNDRPFVEYLRSMGMDIDSLIAQGDLAVHVATPLRVHLSKNNDIDGIPVSRTIKTLNAADGSGVLFGAISEKSIVSVATMKRQDIKESCQAAVKEISDKIAAAGGDYKYGTVLCISCGGRYMVMADDNRLEGDILVSDLPGDLKFAGFYAYGEICPTSVEDGRALNRVHNESIVMCAL